MIACARERNTEALRRQRFYPRISAAFFASPRFKPSPAEVVEGLTRELATQFRESEQLQTAIRAHLQKLGFAVPEVEE